MSVPPAAVIEAETAKLRHPILPAMQLDPRQPLSPEEAAVLAVVVNPALRAQRDRIGLSSAQLLKAGLLPNPQLTANAGIVTGGPGTTNPFGIGGNWNVAALITHGAKKRAAQLTAQSIRLNVAWAEWQTAESAKSSVYNVIAIDRQIDRARKTRQRLAQNLAIVRAGYRRHQQTALQLAAARTSEAQAEAQMLSLKQQRAMQRFKLRKAIGLPPGSSIALRRDTPLPCTLPLPPEQQLLDGLRQRRLDLLGLHKGYLSQEQQVRAAILAQFPKLNLGLSRSTDNSDVTVLGFTATISLPIFNHNQGAIAVQRATRQRLYDEYMSRVLTARDDIDKIYAAPRRLRTIQEGG